MTLRPRVVQDYKVKVGSLILVLRTTKAVVIQSDNGNIRRVTGSVAQVSGSVRCLYGNHASDIRRYC